MFWNGKPEGIKYLDTLVLDGRIILNCCLTDSMDSTDLAADRIRAGML